MLQVDINELRKLIMEERKKYIETPKLDGTGEMISGLSLIITLLLADFSHLQSQFATVFQIIAWVVTLTIFIRGMFLFIKGKRFFYSAKNLFDEICELDNSFEHPFNIMVLKSSNGEGKYLLFQNKRWKSLHFPNYKVKSLPRSEEEEQEYIQKSFADDIGADCTDITVEYIGDIYDRKFSVGDRVYKKFHFYFYQVTTAYNFPQYKFKNQLRSFRYNGKKYKWYTLDQMYNTRSIVKTNIKVLDFVRNHFTIS